MQKVIQSMNSWISMNVSILPGRTAAKLSIRIQDLLAHSYLAIEESSGSCLVPISSEVILRYSIVDKMFDLRFSNYGLNGKLVLQVENMRDLELLVSHFGRVIILFNEKKDEFREENINFLNKFCTKQNFFSIMQTCTGEKTILSPLTLSPGCMKFWGVNSVENNKQFYMKNETIRVHFLTWNVGSKEPTNDVLSHLAKIFRVPAKQADIVVVALEEIDMSFKSVVTGNSINSDKWNEHFKIAQSLSESEGFEVISHQSIGGVFCCALVRKNLIDQIKESKIITRKLGANGMLANKSVVYFKFMFGEASFVVICCHLAAHDQNWEQRNSQWHEIVDGLNDTDYVIFMGDLNYRVDTTYENCIEMINKGKLSELSKIDQLHKTQETDPIIREFKEPELTFNPTFKYDLGKDVYDTSPKHRVPSWTDRILVRTGAKRMRVGLEDIISVETDAIKHYLKSNMNDFKTDCNLIINKLDYNYPKEPECVVYTSLKCSFSDHRPVHAAYKFSIPIIDSEREKELVGIFKEKYSEYKEISVPSMICENTLDSTKKDVQELILKNTSFVWVNWELIKSKDITTNNGILIVPNEGTIQAGETAKVQVTFDKPLEKDTCFCFSVQDGKQVSVKVKGSKCIV